MNATNSKPSRLIFKKRQPEKHKCGCSRPAIKYKCGSYVCAVCDALEAAMEHHATGHSLERYTARHGERTEP